MKRVIFFLFSLISSAIANEVDYNNYKLYTIKPTTSDDLKKLIELQSDPSCSFWRLSHALNESSEVMVPPEKVPEFEKWTESLQDSSVDLIMTNIQEVIDGQAIRTRAGTYEWSTYHDLNDTYDWLTSLAETYPNVVTTINAGQTHENRDILGVHLSFNSNNRAIFLEANIHAREWITSAVCTYILNELLTSTVPEVRHLAESYDWYIFPVFNPDGFAYSHKSDRMWRKTRTPQANGCYGVDANRNWDVHFNENGTSRDPCAQNYAGLAAFSEPNTRVMSQYIAKIANNLDAYIALHSYSQFLLLPYGHSLEPVDNYEELYTIGVRAMRALAKRYGTHYTVGNVVNLLYPASGGSFDWVKTNFQPPLTYTYELRDNGTYGFLLPPEQIIPTAMETLDSLVVMFEEYEKTKTNAAPPTGGAVVFWMGISICINILFNLEYLY